MIKAFISYHHERDQQYKNYLAEMANRYGCFEDCSVGVGDIEDDGRESQAIRRVIRDEYLGETEVTILLCGVETRHRKHVDWELKSSMIDGRVNSRSGILAIDLPTTSSNSWHAPFQGEKDKIYRNYTGTWTTVTSRAEYERRCPEMPPRIIDQLLDSKVMLSVVPWPLIEDQPDKLTWLLDMTAKAGKTNEYDLSRKMRRGNYNPDDLSTYLKSS